MGQPQNMKYVDNLLQTITINLSLNTKTAEMRFRILNNCVLNRRHLKQ